MTDFDNTNLISTWLESELQHRGFPTVTSAIEHLNIKLSRNYGSSRINEWRRGTRSPDRAAHAYILRRALPYALSTSAQDGSLLSAEALDRLSQLLSLPACSVSQQ